MRISACAAVLLLAASAHAQDMPCDAQGQNCGCEKNWGCWELWYTNPGTILGLRTTVTQVDHGRGIGHGVLTSYATEHYGTLGFVSGHFAAFGAIGGGSAGSEGNLTGTLDFGLRAAVTDTSGPFLRLGINGLLLGNANLYVSLFEPMQGRIGYQLLDGETLLEAGLTAGFVASGRYDPLPGTRNLSDSGEIGTYAALHLHELRLDVGFQHLSATASFPYTAVNLLRAALCTHPLGLALCTDVQYVRGDALFGHAGVHSAGAAYAGFTIGLTP